MLQVILKASFLLCILHLSGSQAVLNVNHVQRVGSFLQANCPHLASFISTVCGTAAIGPACCGLFTLVEYCSPSCPAGGGGAGVLEGAALQALMYDSNVCGGLRLTGNTLCRRTQGWSLPCQRLHCLMNMMCAPYYDFSCYYRSMDSSDGNGGGNGGSVITVYQRRPPPGVRGNEGDNTGVVQNNCFELPELADAEMTGLIDESALRQCLHDEVDPECQGQQNLRYRTIDGSCNNLQNPRWGKSFEPQKRLLPAQLVDDNLPRARAKSWNALPQPRIISNLIFPMMDAFADVSNMVMAWGQFIDHDFTGTPVTKNGTQKIKCCGDIDEKLKVENGGPCFPINIPDGDSMGRDCMEFVRSLPYSFPNGSQLVPREQINTLTSFLDGSAVYGNTQEVLDKLRGENGTMRVSANNMLPKNPSGTCKKEAERDFCLLAGDHRVNVFVGLGALHTIFVREHNRIARIFWDLNPNWDDETVFQEARRIVSAQFQHVTYTEWLPLVLDDATMMEYGLKDGDFQYDADADPTVANVFSTAVFRFGHSQVKQAVKIGEKVLQLQDTLMRPRFTLHDLPNIIRGIVSAPTNAVDHFFVDGLTNHMFETNATSLDGLDLVSVNIQRGRDHGLPPFNDWRELCRLPRITDFDSPELILDLRFVYEDPDDVDLFVGLMVETQVPGSLVGTTLACLLGNQFNAIKFGDRFFYETQGEEGFTEDQLREVKKVTLGKILCDNVPELEELQRDVFKLEDPSNNPLEPCELRPSMNMDLWHDPNGMRGSASPGAKASEGDTTKVVQENCFELPELADGELTGLIDDQESELRQCPHDEVDPECQEEQKLRYRTIDGSCNNLQNPRWGKSFEPQKRLLPAQLVDDNLPRAQAKSGNPLPLVRTVSKTVSPMMDAFADVSNMVMAWGQFIDHDFTGTPVTKNGTNKIKCCGAIAEDLKTENGGPCFPIEIPAGDFLGRDCMEFVRSLPYSFPNGTQLVPREQINTLTSFLDASAVYGNTQEVLDKLRGENGTMRVFENDMLPKNPAGTCKKEATGDYCLLAGDHRVNVFVGLGALHTIFVREHNRIARIFWDLNPNWDDETVFQETRRIVSAQFQHVTYAEWLPLVLDDVTMMTKGLKEGDFQYDPDVDPTVTNVFSTATFRFGHSQVKQAVKIGEETLQLQDTLMRPKFTLNNLTDIIRGIVSAPSNTVDNFFVTGLTNHMFENNATSRDGLDLVSVNIQRGRDHGLPPFNDWREFCRLPRITDFNSPELILDLRFAYEDPDDVDLFVGLMVETHVPGSLVGPTLACLLGNQFSAMKFGDRFFYETRGEQERFTEDQLREIKKVTLANILCDNSPDLIEIQRNVFKLENPSTNPLELCDSLPSMDLTNWFDPRSQASNGESSSHVQDNCFELPELADGEMTGLINDQESELRQCPEDLVEPECKDKQKLRYRTIDGSCNNLQNPRWGKSFEPQKRLLPAQLVDDNLPRTQAKNGNPLPMVRTVSKTVSPMMDAFADVTNMVMAWGQFIDHDFTGTPVTKNGTQKIKCCGPIAEELKVENGGPCFPIEIPAGDFLGRDCMEFVRSLPYSFPNGTQLEPREQINTLTSFLDASAVYGNTQEVLDKLRGENGTMRVSENDMLPKNPAGTCKKEAKGDYCFLAGDHRVNVFVGLGALHTIFVREHNRIARIFRDLNPNWNDETVFQETRRILSAQFQHVTYSEWLPLVLDEGTMMEYGLEEGNFSYDPDVNPTVTNVFSTAVFRFGHSQVKQAVKLGTETLQLQDTLMRPKFTLNNLTDIIRGIVSAPTDTVDNFFVTGLTNHMFENNATSRDGLDLVSVNIQRGRDHGLPPFNDWREFCRLPRITDFDSPELILDLRFAYEDPDDVDLFVGLMVETHVPGSLVGPTLACLLGNQFEAMKFGDRFFYETRGVQERFTEDQLREIKKVTLARILCDNIPDLKEIQRNVFKLADPSTNPEDPCHKLPSMDLRHWRSA